MNSKRKGQPGLVGKKIRHRDGTVQTHHVKDGSQTKSHKADRDALRANRPTAKPTVDANALREAVAFDDYDATRKMEAFERGDDYVAESIEVHGGLNPKVVLTRTAHIPVGGSAYKGVGSNEDGTLRTDAWFIAEDTFDRGDRTVNEQEMEDYVRESFDLARRDKEKEWAPDGNSFDGLRERVASVAAVPGADWSGVEIVEVESFEFYDRRIDFAAETQACLDQLWEREDERV